MSLYWLALEPVGLGPPPQHVASPCTPKVLLRLLVPLCFEKRLFTVAAVSILLRPCTQRQRGFHVFHSRECQQHLSDTQWNLLPLLGGQMVPPHNRPGSHHSALLNFSKKIEQQECFCSFFTVQTHPHSVWCRHKVSALL